MSSQYVIPPGKKGRIAAIDPTGTTAAVDFKDGATGTVESSEGINWPVGSTVIVWEDDYGKLQISMVPEALATQQAPIGVVKLVTDDVVVVEVDGRLRKVDSQITKVTKGSTVEVDPILGIIAEIASTPVRVIDLADESSRVEDFIVKVDGQQSLTYADFAGFGDLVEEARELIELSLDKERRLEKIGGKPVKGLLFTGDPGSGKTLLARIISSQTGATFYQINGPAVMGRWVGQSEEVLRAIFDHAASRKPVIIFFDEVDSLAIRRDIDASESAQRVVAQLLTLMDGFHAVDQLLVIAATNRVDQIDPALRRPGRFDREIHFRRPDKSDRMAILELGASRHVVASDVPIVRLADLTDGWSAAEVAAIWNEAAFLAVADGRASIRDGDLAGGFERQNRLRESRTPSRQERA